MNQLEQPPLGATATKICVKCNIERSSLDFYACSRPNKDGIKYNRSRCKKCTIEENKVLRKKWYRSLSDEERKKVLRDRYQRYKEYYKQYRRLYRNKKNKGVKEEDKFIVTVAGPQLVLRDFS